MSKEHLGLYIKKLRRQAGISQDEMAARIKKSKSLIAFVESRGTVKDSTLAEIAKVLNVTFEHLKVYPFIDTGNQTKLFDNLGIRPKESDSRDYIGKSMLLKLDRIIELLEEIESR